MHVLIIIFSIKDAPIIENTEFSFYSVLVVDSPVWVGGAAAGGGIQGLHMLDKYSTTETHPQLEVHFYNLPFLIPATTKTLELTQRFSSQVCHFVHAETAQRYLTITTFSLVHSDVTNT